MDEIIKSGNGYMDLEYNVFEINVHNISEVL